MATEIIGKTLKCYDDATQSYLDTPHDPGQHNAGCMVCFVLKNSREQRDFGIPASWDRGIALTTLHSYMAEMDAIEADVLNTVDSSWTDSEIV